MEKALVHRWGNPDTILVATNLRDVAHLVPHAIAQAKLSAAKVLLVHVIEPTYLLASPPEGIPFVLPNPSLRDVQTRLRGLSKQFQREGVLCEPVVLKGLPREQLPALIKERNIDRVIVGTRSGGAIDRMLLGSVAEDLLHEVDVPVCVLGPHVRPQVRPDQEPSAILFATSFHHGVHQSAKLALELASLYQSRLVLLHVIPTEYASEEEHRQMRTLREEQLSGVLTRESKLWCTPFIAVREGDPAKMILSEANAVRADLIVLGATGATRGARLLGAGVVHQVIAEARVPVITLRQEQEAPELGVQPSWATA